MTLTGRNRHVIFSGVLQLQTESKSSLEVRLRLVGGSREWTRNFPVSLFQTWAILLNDMLLFTQRNVMDTRLTLVCEAISLNDIVDFRSSADRKSHSTARPRIADHRIRLGQDALIFVSNKPTNPYKIRYPSKCLQCAWQTILEQRLKTWQRSIHDESSSADSDLE